MTCCAWVLSAGPAVVPSLTAAVLESPAESSSSTPPSPALCPPRPTVDVDPVARSAHRRAVKTEFCIECAGCGVARGWGWAAPWVDVALAVIQT